MYAKEGEWLYDPTNAESVEGKMIKVGDNARCPQCRTMGQVIWVSQDGKTVGIRCSKSHTHTSRSPSKPSSKKPPRHKYSRNMVFVMRLEDGVLPSNEG